MDKLINWCTQNGNQQIEEDWVNILREKIKKTDEVQSPAGTSLSSMTLQDIINVSLNKEYSLLCTNCGSNSTVILNPLDKSLNSTLAMAKRLGADMSSESKLVWNSAYETPPRLNTELIKPESISSATNRHNSKEKHTRDDDICRISPISSNQFISQSKKRPLECNKTDEQSPPKRKMLYSNSTQESNEGLANSCDKLQDSLSPKLKSKRKFPLRNKVLVRSLFQSSSCSGSEFDIDSNSRCRINNSTFEESSKVDSNKSTDGILLPNDSSQSSSNKDKSTPKMKSIFSTSTPVVPSSSRQQRCDSSVGSSPTLSRTSETGEVRKTLESRRNYSQSTNFVTKDSNVIRRTKSSILRRQSSLLCSPFIDKKWSGTVKDKSEDLMLTPDKALEKDFSDRSLDKKLKDSQDVINEESDNFNALDILCSPVKPSINKQNITSNGSKNIVSTSLVEEVSEKSLSPCLKGVPTDSVDCNRAKSDGDLSSGNQSNSNDASMKNTPVSSILDTTSKKTRISKLSASGWKKLNALLNKSNERVMSYPKADEEVLQEKEGLSFQKVLNVNEKGLSGFTERDVTLVVKTKPVKVEKPLDVTGEQEEETKDEHYDRKDENLSILQENPLKSTSITEDKSKIVDSFEEYDDCNPEFENYLLDLEKQNSVLLETSNTKSSMHDNMEQTNRNYKRKLSDNNNEMKCKFSKLDNSETICMNEPENDNELDTSEKYKEMDGCKENIPTLNDNAANVTNQNCIPNSTDLPRNSISTPSNSYGGFSTAAGKVINISQSSLLQAKRVWEECFGSEMNNDSNKISLSTSEVAGNNCKKVSMDYSKMNIASCQSLKTSDASQSGFSTAGGKALNIKPSSLQRAKTLWSECSGEQNAAQQPPPKCDVPGNEDLNAPLKNMTAASFENNAQHDLNGSSILSDKVGKNFIAFSSASGKCLNISQSSLVKAQRLFKDCDEILDQCSSNKDFTSNKLEGSGTASSKSSKLNVKTVTKIGKSSNDSKHESSKGDQGLDLFSQLEMTIKKSKVNNRDFSSASGSAFQVSDAAMKKAQSIWSSILSSDSDILSEKTDLENNLNESAPKLGFSHALETNLSSSIVSFKKPSIPAYTKNKKGFIKHQIDTSRISGRSSGLPEPSTFISKVSKRFYPTSSYVTKDEPQSSAAIPANAIEMRDKLTDAERVLIDEQFDSIAQEFLLDDEFCIEQNNGSGQSVSAKSDVASESNASDVENEEELMHSKVTSEPNGENSEQVMREGTNHVSGHHNISLPNADKLMCEADLKGVVSADNILQQNKTPTKCSDAEQTSPIICKSRLAKSKLNLLKRNYPLPTPLFKLPGVMKLPDKPFRVPGRNLPPVQSQTTE